MLRRLLLMVAGCSLAACGCSSSASSDAASSPGPPTFMDGAPAPGAPTIVLNGGTGTLTFTPGQMVPVSVQVSPPAVYSVRFSLVGDVQDAFLDESLKVTDPQGYATVALTAPSSPPADFRLRASANGGSAELDVSANTMLTTLEVVPAYAGKRPVTTWVATVTAGGRCDATAAVPPIDGHLRREAPAGSPLSVANVPVGESLRVTVRAGQFAGGCTDVPAFVLGERRSVSVTVADRPLQLGSVTMPVTLGIDRDTLWTSSWSTLASRMASAVVNGAAKDSDALLDAMFVETPYLTQDAFNDTRSTDDWRSRVDHVLASGPGTTAIRDSVTRWITAGLSTLSTEAVAGTLTSAPTPLGVASLAVTAVGGGAPADSGFPTLVGLTWSSAASDQVLFGATAWWQPSRLASTLAESAATQELKTAKDLPGALSALLSCRDIGEALADTDPKVSCDADCMTSRCEDGLATMWNRARNTAAARALIHVTASGSATIDDDARPVSFSGSWVGDASLGSGATHVTGAAGSTAPVASAR